MHSTRMIRNAESVGANSYGVGSSGESFGDISTGVVLVVAIVSLIIAILLLVLVIKRKKAFKGKFMTWVREYLNFRSILISGIIKFVYAFLAVFLTIMSVVVMCQGRDDTVLLMIGAGFAMLILGNILLRVILEMTMAIIVMWENTSDIRKVIVKDEEKPVEAKPVAEEVVVEQKQVEVEQVEAPKAEVPAETPVKAPAPGAPKAENPPAETPKDS